jgi:alcohol dehydrogenase YqhD (iron-dependent ADH family)
MGTGGGVVSQVVAQTPQEQNAAKGAAYTPVQQGPVYQPQYQQYQPQARMAQPQQQMPNYQSGLQAAMQHMMQQYSRPSMRAPLQQGISPSNPMAYRPTMPTANLNRIASPVTYEQMHPVVDSGSPSTNDTSLSGNGA